VAKESFVYAQLHVIDGIVFSHQTPSHYGIKSGMTETDVLNLLGQNNSYGEPLVPYQMQTIVQYADRAIPQIITIIRLANQRVYLDR